MQDLKEVRQASAAFFPRYRASEHHSQLQGHSPAAIHFTTSMHRLPANFKIPARLPLTEGKVHFMHTVKKDENIPFANLKWHAALAQPGQGVWGTLYIRLNGAKVCIYDAAPDALKRRCLAVHPFPLKEPVVALKPEFRPGFSKTGWLQSLLRLLRAPVRAESTLS